jgi:arsenate reductase
MTNKTTIYHNPRCSKSRQTLALLQENKHDVKIIEYLTEIPTKDELTSLIKMLGIKPEQLVRKGEAVFKESFKGKTLSNEEWVEAMIQHPKLIERPIVVKNGKAVLGRPPENVLNL